MGWRVGTVSFGKVHGRESYYHWHVQISAQLGEGGTWEVNMLLFDSQSQMGVSYYLVQPSVSASGLEMGTWATNSLYDSSKSHPISESRRPHL